MWYALTMIFVFLIIMLSFSLCKAAAKEEDFLAKIENENRDE